MGSGGHSGSMDSDGEGLSVNDEAKTPLFVKFRAFLMYIKNSYFSHN
jgi:hypothetical protein